MARNNRATVSRQRRIKVGQRMILPVGKKKFVVRIVEDRGLIGVNGRRLVRIQHLGRGDDYPKEAYEVPAEELIAAGGHNGK